jgi:multidrug resistance protein
MTSAPATPTSDRPTSERKGPPAALYTLFLVVFVNMAGFGLIVPMLPFFAKTLNAEPWQIALMFSAYSLGQFFAEPIWGRLSDRIGRKPVLLGTVAANVVGYIALAYCPNIWFAIAVRLVTGLGAGNISTIQGYVADVTPPAERAGRMGLLGAAFGVGFIVGPGIGGLLVHEELGRLGYQLPMFAAAALCTISTLCVVFFLKESREKALPGAPRPKFLSGLKDAQNHPVISRVLLVTLIYTAGFAGMESTFGLWAEQKFGWGPKEVGLTFMVVGLVSTLTQGLLSARLVRRFGEPKLLVAGVLLFGASLLGQVINPFAWLSPVIFAVGAFGMSQTMPNISALISRSTAPDRQGAMLGLNMASGSAARILGPIVAGALFSGVGPAVPMVVGSIFCAFAGWAALNAGRVYRQTHPK